MTQNIYDDAGFFAGYSGLRRSREGLDGAAEWPTIRALLPELARRHVVDLGCGFGWFCRWAREHGAAGVTGLDVSELMLARAREMTADAAIDYARADLETASLPPGAYDLVYSSLALHYVADLGRLLGEANRALRPGGTLVFSMEHPFFTAPAEPAWVTIASGRKVWPVDSYLQEGPRSTDWLAAGVIKHHRSLSGVINPLLDAGFSLSRVVEWGPTDAELVARPELADERHRPTFLLVSARKAA